MQRLVSVACGLLAVGGIYRMGVLLRGPVLGLFCALVVALLPVAVITSMTLRNYAPFMALLTWALVCFFHYLARRRLRDMAAYILCMLLATATHFTGFFAAAICGIYAGFTLLCETLRTQRVQPLVLWCAAHLPMAALAVFFYLHFLAPGTAGPMWEKLSVLTGGLPGHGGDLLHTLFVLWSQFLWPWLPFLSYVPEAALPLAHLLAWVAAMGLCGMYIAALRVSYMQDRRICLLALTAWALAALLTFTNVYPHGVGRHALYLLPFILLPYGVLAHASLVRLFTSRWFTPTLLLLAATLGSAGVYTRANDEFGLTQADLTAAHAHLNAHLEAGDVIVTGRLAAYFYLLYAFDHGNTGYASYADAPYLHHTRLLAPFNPPWKLYQDWQLFHSTLTAQIAPLAPQQRVWFVALSYRNVEHEHLYHCEAARNAITSAFTRQGVLIFALRAETLRTLLADTSAWATCYHGYQPLIVSVPFPAQR